MLKKTELYIENKQVDLYGDEAFLLNFNIVDISDISAKASSYSKEVDIPATKDNNQTFSHLFNVNSEGYFNPISKKTAEVFVDGVCVMKGYFKLNSITIIDNEYVTYHGVIYEDAVNFVQTLGDQQLSNLVWDVTGTTITSGITSGTITLDDYFGTGYQGIVTVSNTGGQQPSMNVVTNRVYNSNNNGLTFTGGVFGSLQAIPKTNTTGLWPIYQNAAPDINAFVPFYDVNISLTANVKLSTVRSIKWAFRKATYSATTGTWTHTNLTTFTPVPTPVPGSTSYPAISTLTVTLPTTLIHAGEAIYFVIFDANANSSTTPPLPIVNALTSVTGTIQSVQLQTTSSTLINEQHIVDNMSTVTGATNGIYTFPLVDYNQTFPYSATNVTSSVATENAEASVKVHFNDLRPAIFVKHIWNKIFKQAGFKYKSKFLDTNADLFNKLVMIGGVEEDEIVTTEYDSVFTGSTGSYYTLIEPIQDNDTPITGTTTGYSYNTFLLGGSLPNNTTTGYWKINTNKTSYTEFLKQTHTWANKLNAQHGYSGNDYGNVLKALVAGRYKIEAQIDGLSLPVSYGSGIASSYYQNITYRLKIEVLQNGSWVNSPTLFTVPSKSKWVEKKVITFKRDAAATNQAFTLNLNETIELEKGDLCRVILLASAEAQNDPNSQDATAFKSNTQINFGTSYVRYSRCGTWLNKTITSYTDMMPKDMLQKDFVLGIAKMFNLYFEPDKQDPRTIYIEPRDTYYEDGRILNWEQKLDYSNPLDISILSHDQSKNYVFKYADDSSDFNTEQYKKFTPNGLTFGSYKFTSPNEYVDDTQDLELPFASSYLQKISGTDPLNNTTGTTYGPMVITKIIDPDSQKPGYNGDPSSWKKEPRILIYGGPILLPPHTSRSYSFYLVGNQPSGEEFNLELNFYAYAGHYDKPIEPKIDINFYTDTHYLPTTYYNSVTGNTITQTSLTTVDMSQITIGGGVVLTLIAPANFLYNANVDKYIKVVDASNPSNYFIGKIVNATIMTVNLKIIEKYGIGIISNWKLTLIDVQMKYNLYNVFYKQQMLELTDKSARMMTCNFYLTPVDIANFRFNDVIFAHNEYWRVNKIIDYDTSSDVKQTTKMELIKLLRAQTNVLIDYIQGGYFGINGGTGGSTTSTGSSSSTGTTPAVVQLSPYGGVGVLNQSTLPGYRMAGNNIILDANGLAPTYFDMGTTVKIGNQPILDTLSQVTVQVGQLQNNIIAKPIGSSVILTEENSGVPYSVSEGIQQLYFKNTNRRVLFMITLQDMASDGFTVTLSPYTGEDIAFVQILNENVNTHEIFVVNIDHSLVAKFDASRNIWNIQPV